jgi:RNA polymerase sigma factor (sigma-70 family)
MNTNYDSLYQDLLSILDSTGATVTHDELKGVISYARTAGKKAYFRTSVTIRASVEVTDFIQEALIGVFRAASSYCPMKGASFKTYSFMKLNYYLEDYISSLDRANPDVKYRKVKKALKAFEKNHGRTPSFEEIGESIDLPSGEVEHVLNNPQNRMFQRFDEDGYIEPADELPGSDFFEPEKCFIVEEQVSKAHKHLASLCEFDRELLMMQLIDGISAAQLAELPKFQQAFPVKSKLENSRTLRESLERKIRRKLNSLRSALEQEVFSAC